MFFLTFHLAKDEPSKKKSKRIDFLFNVSKTTFFECLNAVSVCISGGQYYCNVTYFLDVKIMLIKSMAHTVLMILNKLNTNQLNYSS